MGLVGMVVLVVAVVLGGLAYDRADARSGCSANDSAFETTAEDCPQDRAASPADEGSFAGADAALT